MDEREKHRRIHDFENNKKECIIIMFEIIEEIVKRIKSIEKDKKKKEE